MYLIWNEQRHFWMEVDDEWLEGVNVKCAKEFNYISSPERLEVVYKDGHTVYYENVHGTWAPVEFK